MITLVHFLVKPVKRWWHVRELLEYFCILLIAFQLQIATWCWGYEVNLIGSNYSWRLTEKNWIRMNVLLPHSYLDHRTGPQRGPHRPWEHTYQTDDTGSTSLRPWPEPAAGRNPVSEPHWENTNRIHARADNVHAYTTLALFFVTQWLTT